MTNSQSSLEELDTSVETPSTPQPLNTSLPSTQDIPQALSPTASMIVGGASPDTQSFGAEQPSLLQNTAKFSSPAPLSSSMTPPPSSQAPVLRQAGAPTPPRASTPTPSILSSPPPTIVNGVKRESSTTAIFVRPTPQQLSNATAEELVNICQAVLAENTKLEAAVREARMSAAHYKLQHNLLSIETEEAAKRMEVEHNMTRREVEVLQFTSQGRDSSPVGQEYIAKLKAYCQTLEDENVAIHCRLDRAKKMIQAKDDQLTVTNQEKRLLIQRIRENREHLTYLRSPGGIFHVATPKTSNNSYPATPQQYRSTPKNTTPMTGRSIRQNRDQSQEPFAALLLADRVLSQENNSAPSTPVVSRRADPRTPIKHSRGVQSLSSLPTTPRSSRPVATNSTLLPSVQFTPQAESRYTITKAQSPAKQSRERRRKSRDSTISASDAEEIARAAMASYREESEEIQESQASQSAAEMLRIDPRESFEVAASRTPTPSPVPQKSGLLQSKIFGSVTKPAVEKRKRVNEEHDMEYSAKKLRVGAEAIGLGIGFNSTRA